MVPGWRAIALFVAVALGLLIPLLLWAPGQSLASTGTAAGRVSAVWDRAKSAGSYRYTSRIIQMTHPAPTLAHDNLGPKRQQIDVAGETDWSVSGCT